MVDLQTLILDDNPVRPCPPAAQRCAKRPKALLLCCVTLLALVQTQAFFCCGVPLGAVLHAPVSIYLHVQQQDHTSL